ncbi:MAG TPA: protein kinase [Gemmatimonadaceae bacterium]|nr:protein kinase [Gemmatimonadaceae bacterium]
MAVIDRDRWRKLEPLLDEALELPEHERGAWLANLRSESPDLAAEMTALLERDAAADRYGFLGAPPGTDAHETVPARIDLGAYLQSAFGDTYAIERELGGGGMGRVFLAREHALGRTVVIKVLPPLLAAGIRTERFAREVRLAATLQHPNIVPLFTAGQVSASESTSVSEWPLAGLPYYVMPYVPGESLRARLARDGRLPLADALSVLRDVARALSFAHEHGVVHRDVKPENVLLAGDAAVVTDFGIAKAITSATEPSPDAGRDDTTLSVVGSAIGTPAYMAPEQAAGDPRVDHRADVYAWGVLAYELLSGKHPFAERTTPRQLLAAQLSEAPAPLSGCAPELSLALTTLVTRCLDKEPAGRPQSVRAILDALATMTTPAPDAAIALWRERVRTLLPSAGLASAGLLVLAVLAYVAVTSRERPSVESASAGALSLAVLPFEALGGDTANAYFGEGIADEIAAALSKVGGLRVASRTSAAAFRSSHNVDVRELGRRLGVNTVLEGRVRRDGDRMRLTVQLTNVSDGLAMWSDVYERQVKDVFRVQDEIARSIVGALSTRLPGISTPQKGRRVSSPGTNNPEAYDLYLRASYLLERRGSEVQKAVEYFEQAIAKDSNFARAYAGLSVALELTPNFGGTLPRAVESRAIDAAQRALALDSTLAEAYTGLGMAYSQDLRWQEAGLAYRRAELVDPGFAPGEVQYCLYLLRIGRITDAVDACRRARVADPLSATGSGLLAYSLSLLGRFDEALAESRRAYELDSSLATSHAVVPLAILAAGHPEEARARARATLAPPFNGIAAYVLGATGDRAGANAVIHELEARPHGEWFVSTSLSYAYLGIGDTARALSAMEAAAIAGERPQLPFADPMFDILRKSRRFARVVKQFRFDERLFTSPSVRRQ